MYKKVFSVFLLCLWTLPAERIQLKPLCVCVCVCVCVRVCVCACSATVHWEISSATLTWVSEWEPKWLQLKISRKGGMWAVTDRGRLWIVFEGKTGSRGKKGTVKWGRGGGAGRCRWHFAASPLKANLLTLHLYTLTLQTRLSKRICTFLLLIGIEWSAFFWQL